MARLRLTVQHCVLTRVVRQYGPHPTSDLLGVDYTLTAPADTEFPWSVGGAEVFVRYFVWNPRPVTVWVSVTRLNPDDTDGAQIYRKRYDLRFPPPPGRAMMDTGLKLRNLSFPGEGRYAIRILRPVKGRWQVGPNWRTLGVEYFLVERGP
jgi:hypothetical protein